jgi:hypothetical protein
MTTNSPVFAATGTVVTQTFSRDVFCEAWDIISMITNAYQSDPSPVVFWRILMFEARYTNKRNYILYDKFLT